MTKEDLSYDTLQKIMLNFESKEHIKIKQDSQIRNVPLVW
jgi:hypothetical protein